MKIIVLYGSGETAKRNEALRLKKLFLKDDIFEIDLKSTSSNELQKVLISTPLFVSDQRLVLAENVPETIDLQKLKSKDDNLTLVLVASSLRLDSTFLKSAKLTGVKIYLFEGEKELTAFPFLDALIEQKKTAFIELKKLFSEYGGMYILAMIYYLLRRNILPLPKSLFIQGKIKTQKQKYRLQDFEFLYQLVLITEFKIKTGVMPEDLSLSYLTEKIISGKYGE